MELIRGADVVAAMNEKLAGQVEEWREKGERLPKLAILRVGERPDDISYERGAGKRMDKIGILHEEHHFPEDISKEAFYEAFGRINEDPQVDGILVLRPLPEALCEKELEAQITAEKDVDGINPINQAKVMAGEQDGFAPCTAEAVLEMLDFAGVELAGKRATVVGRSLVVGKPLAMLLLNRNATVTVCHTRTKELAGTCRSAEVLIAAAGRAHLLGAEHVGEGAVLVDVGINLGADGKLCGDVDLGSVTQAALATPVPGGVGTVTTSVLAAHVVRARGQRGSAAPAEA